MSQPKLTTAEKRCCHMRDAELDWTPSAIQHWREEFAKLPRSEKCRDCGAAR